MLVEYARIVPSLSCIKRNLNSIKKSQSRISSNYNMWFHLKTIHSTSAYLKQKKYIYSKSTNPQFAVLQQITPILELESVSITQGKKSQLVLHDLTSPNEALINKAGILLMKVFSHMALIVLLSEALQQHSPTALFSNKTGINHSTARS